MTDREGDRLVLADLAESGSDMNKPAHTIHFLCFKTIESAKSAAIDLEAEGFTNVRIERLPCESVLKRLLRQNDFICVAETHAVPSEANVFAASDRMETVAQKYDGKYDGWEASVEI